MGWFLEWTGSFLVDILYICILYCQIETASQVYDERKALRANLTPIRSLQKNWHKERKSIATGVLDGEFVGRRRSAAHRDDLRDE
jgi:hypothetical protein